MVLGEGFEKFLERSPVSVMVRGTLERVFDPEKLEQVFTDHALLQYTQELTFAQGVGLMSAVVFRIVPSVGAWYQAHQEEIPVTRQAVDDKLKHLELPTAAGLVEYAGRELGACLRQMPTPHHRCSLAIACAFWMGTMWRGQSSGWGSCAAIGRPRCAVTRWSSMSRRGRWPRM